MMDNGLLGLAVGVALGAMLVQTCKPAQQLAEKAVNTVKKKANEMTQE